jgi:gamma-butyrobetaine dioxygenase
MAISGEPAETSTRHDQSAPELDRVERLADALRVTWKDGAAATFHFVWLRDNCLCEICGDPVIGKKDFRIVMMPVDIAPSAVEMATPTGLRVEWSNDGHVSHFESRFLRDHSYEEDARRARRFQPTLWDRAYLKAPPSRSYDEVGASDAAFYDALSTVREYGLCFLTGAPVEVGVLEFFASRIGYIQENNFGRIQELTVDPAKRSVAFSDRRLVPHNDEPYRASPPGILLFHCIETCPEGGGQSEFVDAFKVAELLRQEDPEGFEVLASQRQAFRRHFDGDVDLQAEFPVISLDEFGSLAGVRINDRVAAPLSIAHQHVVPFYRAYRRLLELTGRADLTIARTLQPGDVAIFDNHRILHGRTGLDLKGPRWLRWAQVERGDFFSTLRVLEDKLGAPREDRRMLRGAYS